MEDIMINNTFPDPPLQQNAEIAITVAGFRARNCKYCKVEYILHILGSHLPHV